MKVSDIRVHLCPDSAGRLKAYCSLTFDHTFVVRDAKLIEGDDGLFLAMPSRKICDHCPTCHDKNHLRARFCNQCGTRLNEDRAQQHRQPGSDRQKLHTDVAHPINARCRVEIERRVLEAYDIERERSLQPGYVPIPGDIDLPALPPRPPAMAGAVLHAP